MFTYGLSSWFNRRIESASIFDIVYQPAKGAADLAVGGDGETRLSNAHTQGPIGSNFEFCQSTLPLGNEGSAASIGLALGHPASPSGVPPLGMGSFLQIRSFAMPGVGDSRALSVSPREAFVRVLRLAWGASLVFEVAQANPAMRNFVLTPAPDSPTDLRGAKRRWRLLPRLAWGALLVLVLREFRAIYRPWREGQSARLRGLCVLCGEPSFPLGMRCFACFQGRTGDPAMRNFVLTPESEFLDGPTGQPAPGRLPRLAWGASLVLPFPAWHRPRPRPMFFGTKRQS